jgi:cytochrome c oxidase subunit 4
MNRPPEPRVYIYAWVALLALLATTFGLAHLQLGAWNPVASLAIAAAKVAIVALVFMRLVRASALVALFAFAGIFALAVMFGLSGTDYATRVINAAPWSAGGTQ